MDIFASPETSKVVDQLNRTNKRLLRRKFAALSKQIREMKELTGKGVTFFFKTIDYKFLRVNGDPKNPICEIDACDPEILEWIEKTKEAKNLERIVETFGRKKHKQFEKLKSDMEQYFRQKEEAGSASDSDTTSPISEFITRQSRDGSTTATVSAACRASLRR